MPWRIAVIGEPARENHKNSPTLQQKLATAIRQAAANLILDKDKAKIPKTETEKRRWITEQFQVHKAPALVTDRQRTRLVDLLLEYWDVLSVTGEYGQTKLMQHEIHTEPGPPIKCRHRPVNPALEPALKKQLEDWENRGVIEPSNSPWSFPLVAAPKKDGRIRWCVDYRKLNNITRKDSFPLPLIDDNLARLSESRIFSCLDGAGAFHVIEIKPEDRKKTAFSTPWGSYQYCRMPFGLTNGPASYSRLVQLALDGIPGDQALPYLDDTIIHSRGADDHFRNLRVVLEAHRKAGLKLQPSKCQLFQDQVAYLGHMITKDGIRPLPQYVEAVKNWPLPKTKTDARVFLGKVGYYRRFIKDFSAIAAPWTTVTGKTAGPEGKEKDKEPLVVTPEMETSFRRLRQCLLEAPILAFPRFNSKEPFIVDTDWSLENNAIGATLSQVQDGKERVIAYHHQKLSKSQAKYPATKGEVLAVLHHLNHWRYYLRHRPFIVRTDHQPLKYIRTMEPMDSHVARWLSTLAEFNFEVIYRPGKKHGNADALSRAPHIRDQAEPALPVGTDDDVPDSVFALTPIEGVESLTREQLRELQHEDPTLRLVRQWAAKGEAPGSLERRSLSQEAQLYASLVPRLKMDETGVLCYEYQDPATTKTRLLLCVPSDRVDPYIMAAHVSCGHLGIDKTVDRLMRVIYFPRMRSEVTAVLATCTACQQKTRSDPEQRHTLVSTQDGFPFQRLSIDFVGPLTPSKTGKKYILTVKDTFTRWLEAYPLVQATATNVVQTLEKQVFCRFGIPNSIHSDRGTQFTGGFFEELGRMLQIRCTVTPAYNPKSNPVERSHRDLGNILRALLLEGDLDWEQALPHAVFGLNTSRSQTTGVSPYAALFGRDPHTPFEALFGSPPGTPRSNRNFAEYLRKMQHCMVKTHEYIRKNVDTAVQRNRRAYHLNVKSFGPGQLVWVFTPAISPEVSKKLQTFWTGPWTIIEKLSDVLFRVQSPASWSLRSPIQVVSIDRLRLFIPPLDGTQAERPVTANHRLHVPGDEFLEQLHGGVSFPQPQPLGPLPGGPAGPGGLGGGGGDASPPSSDDEGDEEDDEGGGGGGDGGGGPPPPGPPPPGPQPPPPPSPPPPSPPDPPDSPASGSGRSGHDGGAEDPSHDAQQQQPGAGVVEAARVLRPRDQLRPPARFDPSALSEFDVSMSMAPPVSVAGQWAWPWPTPRTTQPIWTVPGPAAPLPLQPIPPRSQSPMALAYTPPSYATDYRSGYVSFPTSDEGEETSRTSPMALGQLEAEVEAESPRALPGPVDMLALPPPSSPAPSRRALEAPMEPLALMPPRLRGSQPRWAARGLELVPYPTPYLRRSPLYSTPISGAAPVLSAEFERSRSPRERPFVCPRAPPSPIIIRSSVPTASYIRPISPPEGDVAAGASASSPAGAAAVSPSAPAPPDGWDAQGHWQDMKDWASRPPPHGDKREADQTLFAQDDSVYARGHHHQKTPRDSD